MYECTKCEKKKEAGQFAKDSKRETGLSSWCRDCKKEAGKKYSKRHYKINLRDRRMASGVYAKTNRPKVNATAKNLRDRLREEVLGVYSQGRRVCACCEEGIQQFLCIDHINNDGAEDRRAHPNEATGYNLHKRLRREGYPEGYRVLCFNCNICTYIYGECPHISPVKNNEIKND